MVGIGMTQTVRLPFCQVSPMDIELSKVYDQSIYIRVEGG